MPFVSFFFMLVLGALLFAMLKYNSMITLTNRCKEAWSDIDVQLKRRYNLIPNLVETVKGYAGHEEKVLLQVTEARNAALNAQGLKGHEQAENMLSGALKSLFAVAESYPDLKANQNFLQLQNELVDTEDKIQAARRFYNGAVRDFNTLIQQFPSNFIAQIFKFTDKEFFELESQAEKQPVQVSFQKPAEAKAAAPASTPQPFASSVFPPQAPVPPSANPKSQPDQQESK